MKRGTKGLIAGSAALTMLATAFIAHWEGRELQAYRDIVGVWTICDGETKGVKPGDSATDAQCDSMLAQNLRTYEAGLDRCLTADVPGGAKVAFLSWPQCRRWCCMRLHARPQGQCRGYPRCLQRTAQVEPRR